WRTDHTVAVQILMKEALERLERGARSRHGADGIVDVIAGAVHNPNRRVAPARTDPCNIVVAAATRRHGAERHSADAELTDCNGRTAEGQLAPAVAAI